jgi:hypothetical protein
MSHFDASLHGPSTRREFLRLTAAGLTSAALAAGGSDVLAGPRRTTGVLVLDDCDPDYKDREKYHDNLSCYDTSGRQLFRVSGLNGCEEIGSPHKIALDVNRNHIWLLENVGKRLLQYDWEGNVVRLIAGVQGSALAVEPSTGHVWVVAGPGQIGDSHLDVYGEKRERLASYQVEGWDIAYDASSKAFWLVETELVKVDLEGKVLVREQAAEWCASSIAVNPKTGSVWVTTREHPDHGGQNALLAFDKEGKLLFTRQLGAQSPFRVALDESDGSVWVTIFAGPVLHYTANGTRDHELKVSARAADVEQGTGNIWVATDVEVLKLNRKGDVLAKSPHAGKTGQAWIASF